MRHSRTVRADRGLQMTVKAQQAMHRCESSKVTGPGSAAAMLGWRRDKGLVTCARLRDAGWSLAESFLEQGCWGAELGDRETENGIMVTSLITWRQVQVRVREEEGGSG